LRGDFFAHHNRLDQAKIALEEAVKTEPNLAFAHQALGYYHYRRQETAEADEEMREAMKLGATDFCCAVLSRRAPPAERRIRRRSQLQKQRRVLRRRSKSTRSLRPPTSGSRQAYSRSPKTQVQAVNAAIQAVKLDPATLPYSINLTYLLINNNRFSEATSCKRIQAAVSPAEREMADTILRRLEQAEQQAANTSPAEHFVFARQCTRAGIRNDGESRRTPGPQSSQDMPVQLKYRVLAAMDPSSAADCSKKPEFFSSMWT